MQLSKVQTAELTLLFHSPLWSVLFSAPFVVGIEPVEMCHWHVIVDDVKIEKNLEALVKMITLCKQISEGLSQALKIEFKLCPSSDWIDELARDPSGLEKIRLEALLMKH